MGVARPEDMFPALSSALNRGDVESALALYEPDAGFVTAAGVVARGDPGLRGEFEAMIAAKANITGGAVKTIIVKDVALVFVQYQATVTAPDGQNFDLSGLSTDVLRQQADGSWLSVIDNPYGTALVAGQPVSQEVIEAATKQ
jgi:uncharacterized protein (TIGR02246 family)